MSEEQTLEDLAAAFNDRQITDDEGNISQEETYDSESATEEQETAEDDSAQEETPDASTEEDTQSESEDDDESLAEDESGKKYIPKSRFDKIYARMKEAERRAEAIRNQEALDQAKQSQIQPRQTKQTKQASDPTVIALEVEMLKSKYPQFDPNSESYSPELDQMGTTIYQANQGITRLEAARRAVEMAKNLSRSTVESRQVARKVKSLQSDQGMTSRVNSRTETKLNPDEMSIEQLEAELKKSGEWDRF